MIRSNGFLKKIVPKKKKSNRTILYKKYLEDQKKEEKEKEEKQRKEKDIVLDQEKIQKKTGEKKRRKDIELPYTIAVCSLSKGCGCSHMTLSIAKYMMHKKENVFVVTTDPRILEDKSILSGPEYQETNCKHIIYDFGCMRDIDFQNLKIIKQCQSKILMCQNTNLYLRNLANFVKSKIKFSESWIYIFNFVPEKKEKEVADLMEDYKFAIVPLYDPEENKVTEKILEEVFT